RAGAGEPCPDRDPNNDQQGARGQLAQRAAQEGDAADLQLLLGLARLSRVLLLLVLSRPERRVQHNELSGQGHGRADRRRAHRGGEQRSGDLRWKREGLRREGVRRGATRAAVPADAERRDAEERVGLPLLVPPATRLPHAGEGVRPVPGNRAQRMPRTRSAPCSLVWGGRSLLSCESRQPTPTATSRPSPAGCGLGRFRPKLGRGGEYTEIAAGVCPKGWRPC